MNIKRIIFTLSLFGVLGLLIPGNAMALGRGDNCTANPTGCTAPLQCLPIAVGRPELTCQTPAGSPGQGVDIGSSFMQNFQFGSNPPASLGEFVNTILPQVYTMALLAVLVYLVWGSFKYLMAGGDPKAVQAARQHLTWAVVGMIIVFLSFGIFQLINSTLGNAF